MNTLALLLHILDAMDDICYVSDPDTYELLYVNKAGHLAVGAGDQAISGKCYQVLQQKDAPCDFCTNHLLSVGKKYTWERYNPYLKAYYVLTDTLIELDGHKLRLELARNITEYKKRQHTLQHKLTLEENLVACVKCLASDLSIADSMNRLLTLVGEYYQASRAYIFEIHYETETLENTYEWCKAGVSPEIDNLKNVPLAAIEPWLERFKEQGAFTITSLSALSPESLDYQILEPQGIASLMATPLMAKDKIVGFLGVDNPTENGDELRLLQAVPFFIQDELVKRRMLDELEWLSFKDVLTGFHNRNKYATALSAMMECPPDTLGIIYVDVNGLKVANDTYGHEYGDHVIRKVAAHIKAALVGDVYRIGGDEFVALCPNMDELAFNEMVNGLRSRIAEDDEASISIGSCWSDGNVDAGELVRFADDRMYAEKQNYYKSQLAGQASRKADAVRQLHHDIAVGGFVVQLQPQIDLHTGAVVGAEALVRKQNSCSLLTPPAKFIPVYELEGIVRHLDFHVLDTVCALLKDLNQDGPPFPLTVNLSRMTLMENTLIPEISGICRTYDLDPAWLRIKVSEAASKMDVRFLRGLIADLQRKGFSVALGGFGSEISSLGILASIDFNEIRFDRGFIREIEANPKSRSILEHALSLCRSFGTTRSVAEGIENRQQLALLKENQCDFGQGYFFSEPLGIEEFKIWRENWKGVPDWPDKTAGRAAH